MSRDQVFAMPLSSRMNVVRTTAAPVPPAAASKPQDHATKLLGTIKALHGLGALPIGRYAASNLAAMLDSMECSPVQAIAARVHLLRARMLVEITPGAVVCHDMSRPDISPSMFFEWLVRDRCEVIERPQIDSTDDLIEVFDQFAERVFSAPRSRMDWYRAAFAMGLEPESFVRA